MGRKKIKIEPIQEGRNRQVTYLKRKAGLFKKAYELATLTDSQVAVIVFGHNGRLSQFCSTDMDQLLLRYTEHEGPLEHKGSEDFANQSAGDGGADEEDDEGDEGGADVPNFKGGPPGGPGGPSGGSGEGSGSGRGTFEGRGGGGSSFPGPDGTSSSYHSGYTGRSFGDASSSTRRASGPRRGSEPFTAAMNRQFKSERSGSTSGFGATSYSLDKQSLRQAIEKRCSNAQQASRASKETSPSKLENPANQQARPHDLNLSQWNTTQPQHEIQSSEFPIPWMAGTMFEAPAAQLTSGGVSSSGPSTVQFPRPSAAMSPEAGLDLAHFVQRELSAQGQNATAQYSLQMLQQLQQQQQQQQFLQTRQLQQQQLAPQQTQQRWRVASVPTIERSSFASLESPTPDIPSRAPTLGASPFTPVLPFTSTPGVEGNRQTEGQSFTSSPSALTNSYHFFGPATGRSSISQDGSSSGFSTSSVCPPHRGIEENGNSVGPSGSSTDGTPLLAASSLATPIESPLNSFVPPSSMHSMNPSMVSSAGSGVDLGSLPVTGAVKGKTYSDNALQQLFDTGAANSAHPTVFPFGAGGEAPLFGL